MDRNLHNIKEQAQIEAYEVKRSLREYYGGRYKDGSDEHAGMLALRILSTQVNAGTAEDIAKGFLYALQTEHRTLQSQTVSILLSVLKQYGDQASIEPIDYDARNEHAVKLCCKLSEAIEYTHVPLI